MISEDATPDPMADGSGELLWDVSLRRRAAAAHVAGTIALEAVGQCHDQL